MFLTRAIKHIFQDFKRIPAGFRLPRRVFSVLTLFVILTSQAAPLSLVQAQGKDPVGELMTKMTAEEKVGQLFLVTFTGTDAGPQSHIYDLITNHHIGGVVLTRANDNFVAAPD